MTFAEFHSDRNDERPAPAFDDLPTATLRYRGEIRSLRAALTEAVEAMKAALPCLATPHLRQPCDCRSCVAVHQLAAAIAKAEKVMATHDR